MVICIPAISTTCHGRAPPHFLIQCALVRACTARPGADNIMPAGLIRARGGGCPIGRTSLCEERCE